MNAAASSKYQFKKIIPLAVAGAAGAVASTHASAIVISETGLNQYVANGDTLENIGGMGVEIDRTGNFMGKNYANLSADGQLSSSPLSAGTVIGPALIDLGSSIVELAKDNNVSNTGVFGVQFDNGDGDQFGWVDIEVQKSSSNPDADVTLHGWGFESVAGQAIIAPAATVTSVTTTSVNAPAGLALLAAGGLGLVATRRRKVKAA